LDWVFADGPPQNARVYDNNNLRDFHAIVPNSIPDELYWIEEEHRIYQRLQEERRLREEAIRAKVTSSDFIPAIGQNPPSQTPFLRWVSFFSFWIFFGGGQGR